MSSYTQPCEYQACQCVVTGELAGASYCSEVCRDRDTTDEELTVGCSCGHSPCDATD